MSGNHNQSLDTAMAIVQAAADAGADAIKLQTYTADTITLDVSRGPFVISDQQSPWAGRRLHELYQEAHTPWEWHKPLFDRARELGLLAFSTPFDPDGGRLPGRAGRARLQGRLVRTRRSAADRERSPARASR